MGLLFSCLSSPILDGILLGSHAFPYIWLQIPLTDKSIHDMYVGMSYSKRAQSKCNLQTYSKVVCSYPPTPLPCTVENIDWRLMYSSPPLIWSPPLQWDSDIIKEGGLPWWGQYSILLSWCSWTLTLQEGRLLYWYYSKWVQLKFYI